MDTNKCKECLNEDKTECLKAARHEQDKIPGSILNYKKISILIVCAIILNSLVLVLVHIPSIVSFLKENIGILKFEIIIQFFYGSLGAAITCSLFLSKDMEINALESAKEKPDLATLRYPNLLNVHMYLHRLITSGILAVLGSFLILAGFSYIDFDYSDFSTKHKILLAISSMLIGLYQHKFIKRISEVFDKFYKSKEEDKEKPDSDNTTNEGLMNQAVK